MAKMWSDNTPSVTEYSVVKIDRHVLEAVETLAESTDMTAEDILQDLLQPGDVGLTEDEWNALYFYVIALRGGEYVGE